MTKKILIVIGTRPNFIKVTQFKRVALEFSGLEIKLVHTGQHFDTKMADDFFSQFGLKPDFFLNINTEMPVADQMNEAESKIVGLIKEHSPSLVMVVGDVNSTLAGARAAKRMNVKLAHVESGLRSFDQTMPEEYNRIETDKLADVFFVTEQSGIDNLLKEGVDKEKIFFVGNTMIDTMIAFKKEIDDSDILTKLNIGSKQFVLMTIHRPATVDSSQGLNELLKIIQKITGSYKIIFPIHPRTLKNIKAFGLEDRFDSMKNLIKVEPLDYFSFQKLIKGSKFILTDSGGIQEESTFLKIPCLTLRNNTERPITISMGTNKLIPFKYEVIEKEIREIEKGTFKKGSVPFNWDGNATRRILQVLVSEKIGA